MRNFKIFLAALLVSVSAYAGYTQIGYPPILQRSAACTVTIAGSSNTTLTAVCWREANRLRIEAMAVQSGTMGAAAIMKLTLPNSLVIDTSLLTNGTTTAGGSASQAGRCSVWSEQASGQYRTVCPVYSSTTSVEYVKAVNGGASVLMSELLVNDEIRMSVEVPILGW